MGLSRIVRPIVAAPWACVWSTGIGLVTLVPRTCAVRQELEAWGQQQPALPLLVEKPGRTKDEAPRRWHGQSVMPAGGGRVQRWAGRPGGAALCRGAFESTGAAANPGLCRCASEGSRSRGRPRAAGASPVVCLPADAEAAIAEYEGRGQGRRGRRPRPWRYHAVRYRIVAETRRTRRARRGRPAKTDPPPTESGYRLVVEVEALANPEEDNGWTVLATTVRAEALCGCRDSPGLSRPKYHGGTWFSLDQESRGDRPRVAGEARTDCGLSDADGAGLAGLQRDPATGPSVPAHA